MGMGREVEGLSSGKPGIDSNDQALIIFRESLGLIRSTLTKTYRLPEAETSAVETDLHTWFVRFCERPGAPHPRESRHSLLVMACELARGIQRSRVETGRLEFDSRLDRILRRDPSEVAREVSRDLKILYYALHFR